MSKSFVRHLVVAVFGVAAPQLCLATGDYGPPRWLDQGGIAAEHSPEFYWEVEMRRLAVAFKPGEKRVVQIAKPAAANSDTAAVADPNVEVTRAQILARQSGEADLAELKEAIQKGAVKTAVPEQAIARHETARIIIAAANETTTDELPAMEPSEFADYQRGAFAFRRGQAHYMEAKTAWEALLKRPATERHYRSVWAAFMLGKLALYAHEAEAVKWFQMTRQLSKEGYADKLGLAADSYGWEAKSELDQGHAEKAAELYLTQLALGDDSAIVSLKALVADREPIYGMMNFPPLPPDDADAATLKKFEDDRLANIATGLVKAARDPLLRRITSAHILATETVGGSFASEPDDSAETSDRCTRWLEAIEKVQVPEVDNADQLGWIAYTAGKYEAAARWLKLSSGDSATALWLKAKLLRRSGKLDEAAQAMASAVKIITADPAWTMSAENEDYTTDIRYTLYPTGHTPRQSAGGDLGSLNLTRGDFVNALDAFYKGGLEADAAFVAEHVLTPDELKTYVDALPWTDKDEAAADLSSRWSETQTSSTWSIRWLLGRRLVRADRYAEARPYLPVKYRAVLDRYNAALTKGANGKLPKQERARAWFDAAVIARYDGMEIMGTEEEPDGFSTGGAFEPSDVAGERETGNTYTYEVVNDKDVRVPKPLAIHVAVSKEEKKRLAANRPAPNKRFHYRYIAAALGWKAAVLLPDQSEELADVLNTSGGWIKKDSQAAEKYFGALRKRAAKTTIGKEAMSKRWFIEHYGPWSVAPKTG
jgi:hypothetical protein